MAGTIRAHSPPTPPSLHEEPASKRMKLSSLPPVASTSALPYGKGLHLAPMVRIGTLPTRLLALEYGAELVWGPEIVAQAIIGTTRTVDPRSGTISYSKNGKSIFECHPLEKSRLIFQLGSSDPELAVEAALVVAGDVAGVGLNCGCPKPFSISGGMGAALLKVPDKLCAILRALVERVPVPIDVKIRLLPDGPGTLELVSQLLATGVSALTVHCRTQDMRSSEPALLSRMREITEMGKAKGIPVIANGDCFGVEDRARIEEITGVTSIMIARGAEANASCFRSEGLLDLPSVVAPFYFRVAVATQNGYHNTKYCIKSCTVHASTNPAMTKKDRTAYKIKINDAKNFEEMAAALGVDYAEAQKVTVEELLPEWMKRLKGENLSGKAEKEHEENVILEFGLQAGKASEEIENLSVAREDISPTVVA